MKGKVEIVQLLRGIAALLVCFFHMKGILNTDSSQLGHFLFGNGSIGVPLFFMISGFIMVVTNKDSRSGLADVKQFYLKRAIRILPLYYLLTFVMIIGIGGYGFYFVDHIERLLSGLLFFPTYLNQVGPSYGMPPLEVGWSLNFEVFFYLILGLAIFFGRYRWMVLVGTMLTLVYIVPLITNGDVMPLLSGCYGYSYSYFSLITNPVILFFVVGILVGLFYKSNYSIESLLIAKVVVVLAIVIFTLGYFGVYAVGAGYYFNMAICGLLLFALLLRNKVKSYSLPKPFVFLGDISYSLYLVHPLVLVFLPRLISFLNVDFLLIKPWYFFVATPIIIGLASLTYILVEKRFCGWLSTTLVPKTK